MKKSIAVVLLVIAGLLFLFGPATAENQAGLNELKQKADAFWSDRGDLNKALEAINTYQEVLKQKPDDIQAAVRIAYGYWWLGKNSTEEKAKMTWHDKGVAAAKLAIQINDREPGAHYWLAVNWAEYGKAKGIIKSIFLIKPIRQELAKVRELDEKYLKGGFYRVNGKVYCEVPGLLGGDRKKCYEYYKKAIEIAPDHLVNHLFLAEAYLEDKDREKAREQVDFILNAPLEPDFMPDDRLYKRQAEDLLKKINKK
ncbi:MAG: TRAP transporter TatT component family protein [Proteobacteria bacterium]|nr:TRAP transporter TatT component family protein [Pseudomonadota bacterium]